MLKKQILVAAVVALLLMVLTACGSGNGATSKKLVGVWEVTQLHEKEKSTSIMGIIQSTNFQRAYPIGGTIEFMSNKLVHIGGISASYDFPAEGKIRFMRSGGGADSMVDIELNGDMMLWDFGPVTVEFRKIR